MRKLQIGSLALLAVLVLALVTACATADGNSNEVRAVNVSSLPVPTLPTATPKLPHGKLHWRKCPSLRACFTTK